MFLSVYWIWIRICWTFKVLTHTAMYRGVNDVNLIMNICGPAYKQTGTKKYSWNWWYYYVCSDRRAEHCVYSYNTVLRCTVSFNIHGRPTLQKYRLEIKVYISQYPVVKYSTGKGTILYTVYAEVPKKRPKIPGSGTWYTSTPGHHLSLRTVLSSDIIKIKWSCEMSGGDWLILAPPM